VGVRAIAGEKTAFAYSDEISLPAAGKTRPGRRAPSRAQAAGRIPRRYEKAPASSSTSRSTRFASLEDMQKVKLLERLEQLCRARDPRVIQVMANLGAEYEGGTGRALDGRCRRGRSPARAALVQVIVEQNGRREQGTGGGGGRSVLQPLHEGAAAGVRETRGRPRRSVNLECGRHPQAP